MRLSLSSSRQSQHGAFSIMAAATLLMSLLFLVLVLDSGRLYLEQRHLQKIADTAALETIAKVTNGNCSSDDISVVQGYAKDNANRYGSSGETPLVQCVTVSSINGLRQAQLDSANGRAVKVTTAKTVPASLVIKAQSLVGNIPSTIRLQATAVAERGEPTASFTVGSQLLRLENSKLLGQLLKAVGVNPERLTVLDADGLANATITPAGLLKALGVNLGIHELKALTPQGLIDLVDTKVGLLGIDEILKVSAEVVSDSILRADLDILRQEILAAPLLKDININLFGDENSAGLVSLMSSTDGSLGSALDASINLGDLISTSILLGVHETGQGLLIPGLNLLGQTVELGIVEPPSIGVGPVGTQAYNAQVRLYLGVDTSNLLGGALKWLTETILGTRINLPIWIDLVSGHGTLEKISCNVQPPSVDIAVESKILNVCIGKLPDELKWSGSASCESNLQNDELIKLLHIPILSGKTHIPALQHDVLLTDMLAGSMESTSPNKLALGNTVEGVVSGLLDLLSGLFRRPDAVNNSNLDYSQAGQDRLIESLAIQYLEETALPGGLYHIENVTNLILYGESENDINGQKVIPPLVDHDWFIPNSIPRSCLLTTCPTSMWKDGTFTEAFKAYSEPHGLLNLLLPSQRGGYRFCGNLIDALVDWNPCVKHNLTKLLQEKPGGINMSSSIDGDSIASSSSTVKCSGILCILLKPVILLLKPILNGVGGLLNTILNDVLGIELGRTDVTVSSINCNNPVLVR
ncbi:pilus assembly protein TadG-related protein [Denitrificimonas caeni]|uniref:pilus assembly protein TadG-related protein n=1 Tax=Denitrificimonas caeni TaxID=521720 RepID=UPI0019630607|nr:pilus assembly protein TadG-related protein [Denitrificimonas caeni]